MSGKKAGLCNECGLILAMSQSSTSTLRTHLRSRHPAAYTKFKAEEVARKQQVEDDAAAVAASDLASGKVVSHGKLRYKYYLNFFSRHNYEFCFFIRYNYGLKILMSIQ